MEYEHMSFPDAVAALAQDVGLPVPESAQEPIGPNRRPRCGMRWNRPRSSTSSNSSKVHVPSIT